MIRVGNRLTSPVFMKSSHTGMKNKMLITPNKIPTDPKSKIDDRIYTSLKWFSNPSLHQRMYSALIYFPLGDPGTESESFQSWNFLSMA